MVQKYDFIIIGGGIGGLNIAYQILKRFPTVSLLVLEKEKILANQEQNRLDLKSNEDAILMQAQKLESAKQKIK